MPTWSSAFYSLEVCVMILTLLLNLVYSRKLIPIPGINNDDEDDNDRDQEGRRGVFGTKISRYRYKIRDLTTPRRVRSLRATRERYRPRRPRSRSNSEERGGGERGGGGGGGAGFIGPIEPYYFDDHSNPDYFTIRLLRVLSDKLGAISMLLFIANLIMASLTHTLRLYHIDAVLFTVSLELCWQISESMFLFATFFGLFRIFLSWAKRRTGLTIRILSFTTLIAILIPISYLFVGIEHHRWQATVRSTEHVFKEAFWDFAIWVRHVLWGKDSNYHWTWLGTEYEWLNRPNPTKLLGFA